jgi:hypothetical protein
MGINLDLSGAQENSPVPDGTYPVILNKAEVTPTKSGGTMIKIQMKITEGPQAGRVVFDQFNIENVNPQAVQIGLGQLKGMMKAFGHTNPNMLKTTDELLGLKGSITVKTVDDGGSFGPQVRVRAYKTAPTTNGVTPPASEAKAHSTSGKAANPFS